MANRTLSLRAHLHYLNFSVVQKQTLQKDMNLSLTLFFMYKLEATNTVQTN